MKNIKQIVSTLKIKLNTNSNMSNNFKKILLSLTILIIATVFIYLYINKLNKDKCDTHNKCATYYIYGDLKERPNLKDNFYGYFNYEWLHNTQTKDSIDAFDELENKNRQQIEQIFTELINNYDNLKEGSDEKKLIDFYNMALDFETRNKLGVKPIQSLLDIITNIKDIKTLNQSLDDLIRLHHNSLLVIDEGTDFESDNSITMIDVPKITLSKSHFENTTQASLDIQQAYRQYIIDLLVLNGNDILAANKKSDLIFNFEKELSSSFLSAEDSRSKLNIQNNPVYSLKELEKLYPNLDFRSVFKAAGFEKAKKINILQPQALTKLNSMFTQNNIETIKAKIEFDILDGNHNFLSRDFLEAGSRFRSKIYGTEPMSDDKELVYNLVTNSIFSKTIGKLYVERYFSEQAKVDVENITKDIIAIYKKRISGLDWLEENTKLNAIKKLDNMTIKMGYPNQWEDYSGIVVKTYNQGGNLIDADLSISNIIRNKSIKKIDKPQDRISFDTPVYSVNASYYPLSNEIVFLAGILQPPFYDINESRETNLGRIGVIIGHEISHAFDKGGSQFDADGNLRDWWTESDKEKYNHKIEKFSKFLSSIEVLPGEYLQGSFIVSESMADLGGLTVILDLAKSKNLSQQKVLEAYPLIFRTKMQYNTLVAFLARAPYPDSQNRLNITVGQMEEFYKIYNIKESDKMYIKPEDRVKFW